MRRLITNPKINPALKTLLDHVRPGFANIHARNLSFSSGDRPLSYCQIMSIADGDLENMTSQLSGRIKTNPTFGASRIDLSNKKTAYSLWSYDVEIKKEDAFGHVIIGSRDPVTIRYGKKGITPSRDKNLNELLEYKLVIPDNSLGVLDIENHVPFRIETTNPEQAIAIATSKITRVAEYSREQIEKMYSLDLIATLPEDFARMVHLEIQRRIFTDKANEKFHEEVTSVITKPTEYNSSSGTLMNFERRITESNNSTDSHYHPGDRVLYVCTIGKEAGVTLNFCGICEDPDKRKDCEVRIDFPTQSMNLLRFPAYTHHKFNGDFVCTSIHPMDGKNILEAVESGKLPKGFLESATVFSPTTQSQNEWNSPISAKRITEPKGFSRS
jgi:hypothetical protein